MRRLTFEPQSESSSDPAAYQICERFATPNSNTLSPSQVATVAPASTSFASRFAVLRPALVVGLMAFVAAFVWTVAKPSRSLGPSLRSTASSAVVPGNSSPARAGVRYATEPLSTVLPQTPSSASANAAPQPLLAVPFEKLLSATPKRRPAARERKNRAPVGQRYGI